MTATALSPITETFIDKCDPEDPEYQRDLIRPVEIKEDVKLMEQRKRVSIILKSKTFRKELEDVIRKQCQNLGISDSSASLLSINHISEQLLLAAIPRKTSSAIGVGVSTNGIIPINDLRDGLICDQNERQVRCKMAAVHRLMDMFSWCNGSSHCITARVNKDADDILMKPFGLFFHEVTASCLITIDSKGNVKNPGSTVLSADYSHWPFHSSIHTIRQDICCLIFLRTPAALCVSGSNNGFLPISSESVMLGEVGSFVPSLDSVDLDSDSGVSELQREIYKVFDQNKKILIIPNHGIFVGGISVEETWFLVQRVQTACEVQELLYKLNIDELVLPDKEAVEDLRNQWNQFAEATVGDYKGDNQLSKASAELYMQKYRVGLLEFEAVMRHLDNSGYRTGYLYQTINVHKWSGAENGDVHVAKYPDVEIPPSSSSLFHGGSELGPGQRQDSMGVTWFNTPNTYKLDDTSGFEPVSSGDLPHSISSSPEHRKTRWITANPSDSVTVIPHHPVTPGAHITIVSAASSSAPVTPSKVPLKFIDPKELKARQKKVKDKYYYDKNTAGPQSSLLDGITWDEARRVRDEGLTKFLGKSPDYGDEPLITAASKGIIQRDHKHHAVVLDNLFKPSNPFDKVTDDDLVKYKEEVDRKMHPERYKMLEMVTSKSDTELVSPTKAEAECSIPQMYSIPQDTSVPNLSSKTDQGMTSDSDYPGDSSIACTAPESTLHGTITSETSAADLSHDDAEKESKRSKDKKKKKLFKSIFGKKSKKKEDKN